MTFQEGDFFDAYPALAYKPPFVEIVNNFSKKEASELAWYIYLYCDPSSEFRNLPPKTRQNELEKNFVKREVHSMSEVQDAINSYDEHMMSLTKRNLKKWEDKLTERQAFIDETEYNENTFEMLDKMMAQTDKMWKMFMTLKKELEKESDDQTTYGGVELSASETGMI